VTERTYIFWGLLPLLVPLVSAALDGGWTRVDRFFVVTCPLIELLLLGFAPAIALSPGVAVAATIAISVWLLVIYVAISRPPTARMIGLVWVMVPIDGAGLAANYLSLSWAWSTTLYSLLLLLLNGGLIIGVNRLRRGSVSPA
jgi:hypothetical protein